MGRSLTRCCWAPFRPTDIKSNPEVIKQVCTQGAVHPRPKGCSEAVYLQLKQCFRFDPSARPAFRALADFFAGVGKEVEGGDAGRWAADADGLEGSDPRKHHADGADSYNLGYQEERTGAYDLGCEPSGAGRCLDYDLGADNDLGHEGVAAGADYDLSHDGAIVSSDEVGCLVLLTAPSPPPVCGDRVAGRVAVTCRFAGVRVDADTNVCWRRADRVLTAAVSCADLAPCCAGAAG